MEDNAMKEIRTVIIGFGGMGKKYAKIIAEYAGSAK